MMRAIIMALVMMSAGLVSAEDIGLESVRLEAARALSAGTGGELSSITAEPVNLAAAQDAQYASRGNQVNSCALFVESVRAVKGDAAYSPNKIVFTLRTHTPGDSVVEAGYIFKQGGAGPSEWDRRPAYKSGTDTWVVSVSIPARFNNSYADLVFYAKTPQGRTIWLNSEDTAGKNFRIDVPLYYVLDGFSQGYQGEDIDTLYGPKPEVIRQFNPVRCDSMGNTR